MIHRSVLLLTGALALFVPLAAVQVSVAAPAPTAVAATSSIGDLAPFRAIAADTLKIVETGDLAGAKARIKDLETTWDQGEATMKPRNTATWTTIDQAIDAALKALRSPGPKAADCTATLKALIAQMDAIQKPA